MTLIQTLILSIIEGITEFLPISSTGHLILANRLLGVSDSNFTKSFEIVIQLGAVLAVVVLYWRRVFTDKEVWKRVIIAFIPTAILGFIFYKSIKKYLLSNGELTLWSLFLGGIALIVFELWYKKKNSAIDIELQKIDYKQSIAIGIAQSIAMIPGVSRSAATIVGGLIMGISRETIVEFSFLLAAPTMATAAGFDLLKSAGNFSFSQFHLLTIGFIISFIVALTSIKWLLNFIKSHTFIPFGVYRIIAAILFWLFVIR
ncbi:MAG TPA: undecaprenyl-diphosphate phosphatase [Candidatus Bathyarchaeia archaeon]|nr:undecaprenyl-diphosphate phosphatase [Candidatus Bathyarchaeia archaeon]